MVKKNSCLPNKVVASSFRQPQADRCLHHRLGGYAVLHMLRWNVSDTLLENGAGPSNPPLQLVSFEVDLHRQDA